jgi:hypothetical protein
MTALHDIQVTDLEPINLDTRCPRCRVTWGRHHNWDCPNGGEWPVHLRGGLPIINDEDEDEAEDEDLLCPSCDGHRFRRTLYGGFTENHLFDTETDHEDWNDRQDGQIEDYGTWECRDCGETNLPEHLIDYINDHT